jgi:hypothetical protein
MAPPDAAVDNYRAQQRISVSTLGLARRLWARLGVGDFDQAWKALGPQMLVVLMSGQQAAVQQSAEYVPAVLAEIGVDAAAVAEVVTRSLVGVASDGRNLADLLYQPIVQTRTALGQGMSLPDALTSGRHSLDRIVTTQVADAGRAATSVEQAVRPSATRWVRMLVPPSCDRCTILAGRVYKWDASFDRHERCDCTAIPADENVAGDLTTDPRAAIEAAYHGDPTVTGLSRADLKAIVEDGADPAKVVNAKRGMFTEQGVKLTREGTKTRGKSRAPRVRPESIYKLAGGDRAKAIQLLEKFGYIVP